MSQRGLLARAQGGDEEARSAAVEENQALVWSVVRRYLGRGVEAEELFQLGCIGLIKAIDGYDPRYGTCLSTYAVPKIAGEIRRYLRDNGPVKLGRGLQEQNAALHRVTEDFSQRWGRAPTLGELAAESGLPPEEVALSLCSGGAVLSLQAEDEEGGTLADRLSLPGEEERLLDRLALREAMDKLSHTQQMLLQLRFFRDQTQVKTAKILGMTQVQVSRLEKKTLGELRRLMD